MRGRNDRIAVLREVERAPSAVRVFLDALGSAGFRGEIENDHAIRTVLSTDNSIYQRFPQAAIFPADDLDVALVARLAGEERFRSVVLTPRGGGTGTNGQSLTDGIVVDLSRHLHRILEVNVEERWVRVQPGVVKDQLNAAVAPYGLFFAPELSTSNRATIGGMISTDASGQGSCTYGKTRDHVLALETVLIGGERFSTHPLCDADLRQACENEDRSGEILRCLREIVERDGERIDAVFPELNRCLTGYDLRHLRNDKGDLDPNSVICGSEGTLGFLVEAKLNLLVVPTFSVLVNIRYRGFMDALRDARSLLRQAPLSIETVDSKVLGLAKDDIVWGSVAEYFPDDVGETAAGINLVEFAGHDMHEVEQRLDLFLGHLDLDRSVPRLGYTVARGRDAVRRVYAMRKRAVGLLGNVEGEARPQPFVEDTAVPPERLADFIGEFRALLDGHDLDYGMFGHVDAGVLHVRPLLNMRDPGHRALIRPISDAVEALTRRYGGLLWGEHGKGVRSEYVPEVFGELYPVLQQIKTAFDPSNQMNPGKIATPSGAVQDLLRVDVVPMRGQTDQGIEESVWQSFGTGVHCNGNGACYNHDVDDPMCPSWKATRNRIHSPKGRASLLREWLRLQGKAGVELMGGGAGSWRLKRHRTQQPDDFSHQVYDAMAGCLACKSCATQCPVKVDVPDFRSRFLHLYHTRYVRPLRDYVVGGMEHALPWLSRIAPLYNVVLGLRPVRFTLEKILGLVDTPKLAHFDFKAALTRWNVTPLNATVLSRLSASERNKSVIFMPDMFTRYFEPHLLEAFMAVATKLGFQVFLAPSRAGGKPLHVHGFLRAFSRVARRQIVFLQSMEKYGVPIVGFDPAMTLIYRQEYRKIEPDGMWPKVMLLQEWLREATRSREPIPVSRAYRLMLHCTEKTSQPQAASDWREVFAAFGLELSEESTGCCGMSGTYGHEQRNRETSAVIFGQSWGRLLDAGKEHSYLATGFSCRSQVRRERSMGMLHPVEILNDMLAVS